MMIAFFFATAVAATPPPAPRQICSWCVFGRKELTDEVANLSKLEPKAMLAKVRKKGVCVETMSTGRRPPAGSFGWGGVEKPKLSLKKAAAIVGESGHTFCKGEAPESRSCPTIVLANDAPKAVLLREYIHYQQSTRDPNWCPMKKKSKGRALTGVQWRLVRDHEWDAYLILWNNMGRLKLDVDDKIMIANGIINEAEQRKVFDTDGKRFLEVDKPRETLDKLRLEFDERKK